VYDAGWVPFIARRCNHACPKGRLLCSRLSSQGILDMRRTVAQRCRPTNTEEQMEVATCEECTRTLHESCWNVALMSWSHLHFRCSMLGTPQQTCSRRKKNLRSSLTGRRRHSIALTLVTSSTLWPRFVETRCRRHCFPSCPRAPSSPALAHRRRQSTTFSFCPSLAVEVVPPVKGALGAGMASRNTRSDV
jgi:hypothetical protein